MNKVYIVLKNADFTEGRGPMMPHKVFKTYMEAYSYIQSQEGIFGTPQDETPATYSAFQCEYFNGYDLYTFDVE